MIYIDESFTRYNGLFYKQSNHISYLFKLIKLGDTINGRNPLAKDVNIYYDMDSEDEYNERVNIFLFIFLIKYKNGINLSNNDSEGSL